MYYQLCQRFAQYDLPSTFLVGLIDRTQPASYSGMPGPVMVLVTWTVMGQPPWVLACPHDAYRCVEQSVPVPSSV